MGGLGSPFKGIKMNDPLREKEVLVTIGKKSFDQTHVPAYRVIEASKRWNAFMGTHAGDGGSIAATEEQITGLTIDLAIYLLQRNIDDDFYRWWSGLFINKKKLLKSLSFDELNAFVELALDPILGSKKKALAVQKKLYDQTTKTLEAMAPEDLVKLLQNLPALLAAASEKQA